MTHLAVTGTVDGKNVNWMEKVSDEQYKPLAPSQLGASLALGVARCSARQSRCTELATP